MQLERSKNHMDFKNYVIQKQEMKKNICPECGQMSVSRCRCPIGDQKCSNGHQWHEKDGVIVSGSGH